MALSDNDLDHIASYLTFEINNLKHEASYLLTSDNDGVDLDKH